MKPLNVRLPLVFRRAEEQPARMNRLFINENGEPTKLSKGVAAVTLTANALGLQAGPTSEPPAPNPISKSVSEVFGNFYGGEPPGYQVGGTRVVPAEEAQRDAFTPAQRNAHDLVASLAATGEQVSRQDLNPDRVASLMPAYNDALEVVELARPPLPPASMPRQVPEYQEMVSAHRSNVLELDEAAVGRVTQTFAARGIDLSDEGLGRFATVRDLPVPTEVNRSTAQQLMAALDGKERLDTIPAEVAGEDALLFQALEQLPLEELVQLRGELGVAAPAGELGVQEQTLGNVVIEQPFIDAFRNKLATAKQSVAPEALPAFKAARGLPGDATVDIATARALIEASRMPPPPAQRVVDGYIDGVGSPITVTRLHEDHWLRADAAEAFRSMKAAAAADGIDLGLNSAFRSHDEQKDLYAKYLNGTGNLAARPGYSNHEGGIAVDIPTGGTGTAVYRWLADNAGNFGFVRTVPSEPWHWEYHP